MIDLQRHILWMLGNTAPDPTPGQVFGKPAVRGRKQRSPRSCQAATQLDINLVSAQLSRLVNLGLVTKVSLPAPSRLGFQVSERFFNIWYLMRASRRLRRRMSWFVEFLRIFYGDDELRRRAEDLLREAPSGTPTDPVRLLAFASAVPNPALRRHLEVRAIGLFAEQGVTALREVMDVDGEDVPLAPVVDRVQMLREIRARIAGAPLRWPSGMTAGSVADSITRDPILPLALKHRLSMQLAGGDGRTALLKIGRLERALMRIGDVLRDAVASGEAPALGDVRTAEEMHQILALGRSPYTSTALLLCKEYLGRPLSDDLLRQLLVLGNTAQAIAVAESLLGHCDWAQVRRLVRMAAEAAASPLPIESLASFFAACRARDLTAEALALVVDAGKAEPWAPLYEALRAAAERSPARLWGLAPEMRAVATALYEKISSSSAEQPRSQRAPRKHEPTKRGTHEAAREGEPGKTERRRQRRRGPRRRSS